MAKQIDWLKYTMFGAGAVIVPKLIMGIAKVEELMQNQFLSFEFMGITSGAVILSTLSILAIDQLLLE